MKVRVWTAWHLLAFCAVGCRPAPPSERPTDTLEQKTAALAVREDTTALDSAARRVLSFLRGQTPFDSIRVADTVVLYLTPEIGGARVAFSREQLRDRAKWAIPALGHSYSLVPPTTLPKLTTKVGRHMRCFDYPLSSIYPELARLPHVGVQLTPERMQSCLQSWNVTFVFDSTARPPRLVAAVYDQFEW